jgi:putative redox protein
MRTVEVAWDQAAGSFSATGTAAGHRITISAPAEPGTRRDPTGFSPADLLLAAVGSCSAWDVVEILRKARQPLTGVTVRVEGDQEAAAPWTFRRVAIHYTVRGHGVDPAAAERAVRLSVDRYCSVLATIRPAAEIVDTVEVLEEAAALA